MKFLVMIEGVPGGAPMPPEQFLPLAKANSEWIKRMLNSGRCEVTYLLADHAGGTMGGFGIINYDSAEQMAEDLATFPGAAISNYRVYPLVSTDFMEKFASNMEAMLKK
jgi:hypothetical protein